MLRIQVKDGTRIAYKDWGSGPPIVFSHGQFSETDFTDDLKSIDIPALIMHGEDDQIVPIVASGRLSAKFVKGATLKTYPGLGHGMAITHADQINQDLLRFFKS